jgi:predicted DNA-binding protein
VAKSSRKSDKSDRTERWENIESRSITIRLTQGLYDRVVETAKRDGAPKAHVIRVALEYYFRDAGDAGLGELRRQLVEELAEDEAFREMVADLVAERFESIAQGDADDAREPDDATDADSSGGGEDG